MIILCPYVCQGNMQRALSILSFLYLRTHTPQVIHLTYTSIVNMAQLTALGSSPAYFSHFANTGPLTPVETDPDNGPAPQT